MYVIMQPCFIRQFYLQPPVFSRIDEKNPSIWTSARVPTNIMSGNVEGGRRGWLFRETEREGMEFTGFG